jgi:hypothetical protein
MEQRIMVRLLSLLSVPLLLASCATQAPGLHGCATQSLAEVTADPLRFDDRRFCGHAFAFQPGRELRLLQSAEETLSTDLVTVVTTKTRPLLGFAGDKPKLYYIRARVDPMEECFRAIPENGETCVPHRWPVFFHLQFAKPLPSQG